MLASSSGATASQRERRSPARRERHAHDHGQVADAERDAEEARQVHGPNAQLDAQGEDHGPQEVGVALDALAQVEDQLAVPRQVARVEERDVRVVGDEIEQARVRHQHHRRDSSARSA